MKQTTGKGKQWLMLPVVLLFLCACGTQKQMVEMSSEVYELPQNCEELTVTADVGSVFIQKGEKAELKTEHVVSQWLTVTEENDVVTVSYIPPDEKAVEGMDTDSHHLTLTLPEEWMPEKAVLTAGTGPFYMDGAEAKDLFLHQGAGQMMLKHVTAENLELESCRRPLFCISGKGQCNLTCAAIYLNLFFSFCFLLWNKMAAIWTVAK